MNGLDTFNQLEPNEVFQKLIRHIETTLPEFSTSDEFANLLKIKKNEDQHTIAFCLFMNNRQAYSFVFQREIPQKGSFKVDIGVHKGTVLLFTIEAKLLPTPIRGKKSKRKKYEYVYGKSGGIQRFKDGNHGLDHQLELLPENGLIAFVKKEQFEHWLPTINQWIKDVEWDESEQLQKVYFNTTTAKLLSKHKRVDGSDLTLHHFWVYVYKPEKVVS